MSPETEQAIQELTAMFAALDAAPEKTTAFTTRELMEASGRSEKGVVELVRRATRAGLLKPTRKRITDLAGRLQAVPAYELVK